jgi:multidrug efflux pump
MVLGVAHMPILQSRKKANQRCPAVLLYVSTGLDGISPTDAERLLLEPMETEFDLTGLRMNSDASEGF